MVLLHVLAFAGLVGLVQGTVWLGSAQASPRQQLLGMWLAPAGLTALATALLAIRVPLFFSLHLHG
ncbi:MAG: hypothetical protein V3V08_09805 [Nannocystaceae bacterium]